MIFILIYACNNGTPDDRFLDLGRYISGVILPNIDWHIYTSSYRVAPVRLRYAREVIRRVGGYWMGRVSS